MATSLANELGALRSDLLGIAKEQRPLTKDEVGNLAQRLLLLQRLAKAQDQELAVHRLAEATGRRVMVMNDEAVTAFSELVEDPEGKIIRPDFGRDKP